MKSAKSIGTSTQICAVIGTPIAHSLSPAIHNAAYQALGLDFVYVACEVSNVKGAISGLRALGNFRGFSVTIPHKMEVMKYVDDINEVDRSIGAINTVVAKKDKLVGLGTDGPGALKALTDAGVSLDGKRILMLGAGGAARSIAFALAYTGKLNSLMLLDINQELVEGLGRDLKRAAKASIDPAVFNLQSLEQAMAQTDIIINCTPVGMHPKERDTLVPIELFTAGQVVFDVVYTPLETRLLAEAKSCGLKTISGVEMFINQAVLQFEQFTGVDAPIEVMRKVVMEHLTS